MGSEEAVMVTAEQAWRNARVHCIEWACIAGVIFFVVGGVIGRSWAAAVLTGLGGGLIMFWVAYMGADEEWERWRKAGLFTATDLTPKITQD